jgi:hypothetical protein
MKLTKLQRYTMYCILLQEIEERKVEGSINLGRYYLGSNITGICDLMAHILEQYEHLFYITEMYGLLELEKFKPLDRGCYWVDSVDERIAALKKCIEETHPDK